MKPIEGQPNANANRSQQLDFLLALFRPLLTTEEAGFLLDDCVDQQVLDLLDEHKLAGVNIATKEDTRRTIRIYRHTVLHRIMVPLLPLEPTNPDDIIPHSRPTILRHELALWLGCTQQHISNLNLPGPRDSHDTRHRIYRDAVVTFLKSRAL